MNVKKLLAEFIGTFTLSFVVALSLGLNLPLSTPVLAAVTVGLFVYTVGAISGAHFNPAVTIALASVKKISLKDGALYIVAQFLGAALTKYTIGNFVTPAAPTISNTLSVGIAEALGAFFLVFGVASVVYKKVEAAASGLTIGSSLLLGILIASSTSNGVLNPAVALGIGSFSTVYALGPILGGLIAIQIYKTIAGK